MAYHTYEFLERRKDEPKWHDAYVQRKKERDKEIRAYIIGGIVFVISLIGYLFYISNKEPIEQQTQNQNPPVQMTQTSQNG